LQQCIGKLNISVAICEGENMSDVNIDQAVSFVKKSGDAVLSALASFATGQINTREALNISKQYQLEDGGWTKTDKDFQAELSVISTTWVALQWLLWIDARDSIELQNTLEYVHNSQNQAGYWDEPEEIRHYNPPHWMLPGRYENQLWLTSAICCKLKDLGCEYGDRFGKALDFIRKGWDGQRYPLFHHTNWMVMGLLGMLETKLDLDSQIITGCKKHLLEAIENDLVDPGDLSAIAYASKLAGDQAQDLLEISARNMQENQLEDGGWRTNYGEKHRPGLTVDALFTLKRLG
jgi:hypothetical protein